MKILRRVVIAALGVALLVLAYRFGQANGEEVAIDLLWYQLPGVPQWMVILAASGMGLLLAGLLLLWQLAKLGLVNRRYRKAVKGLESEIHQLRSLPLASEGESAASTLPPAAVGERGGAAGPSA